MGSAVGVLTAAKDLRISALVSLAGMARTADFYEREFGALMSGKDCMWEEPDHPLSEKFASDMKSTGDILAAAAAITQPWLLIHGTADDLVPVEDSRAAHAAAFCVKRLIEIDGAGHAFDEQTWPQVVAAVDAWLSSHLI
jgi:pimeloyl-ACP methyl ester carboxylesterase